MTSYIAITDAETDPEAPLTSELAKKWRDNPIAIGEADSTVPAGLLPTVHLGTLTTTSGTTQTLSGLVLTPYKALMVFINGVSNNAATSSLLLNGIAFAIITSSGGAQAGSGGGIIDLSSGIFWSSSSNGTSTLTGGGASGLSTASTSITFAQTGGATFDAGSIRIYGVK